MPRLNHQNPPIPRRNHQNQDLLVVIRRDLKEGAPNINMTLGIIASFFVAKLITLFTFLYTRDVAKQHTDIVRVQSGYLFFAIGLVAATFVGSSVYINYQKNKLDANDSNAPPHFLNDFDTPPLLTDSDTKEVIGFDTNYENLKNHCKLRLFGSNLG
ncbi:hypothetical protein Tco_1450633 [Tanacetum coccineum]